MRFLCAEDNELNAEILQAMLEMAGASCEIFPNGQAIVERISQIQAGEYDAVLMDAHISKPMELPALEKTIRTLAIGENPAHI